mmetsp:Transcript_22886/g.64829  ORF Transcript_22886/g.64829 Transcript_22886/m.64829 type:complete len:218 (-) Transcript_22886:139-792(-)
MKLCVGDASRAPSDDEIGWLPRDAPLRSLRLESELPLPPPRLPAPAPFFPSELPLPFPLPLLSWWSSLSRYMESGGIRMEDDEEAHVAAGAVCGRNAAPPLLPTPFENAGTNDVTGLVWASSASTSSSDFQQIMVVVLNACVCGWCQPIVKGEGEVCLCIVLMQMWLAFSLLAACWIANEMRFLRVLVAVVDGLLQLRSLVAHGFLWPCCCRCCRCC